MLRVVDHVQLSCPQRWGAENEILSLHVIPMNQTTAHKLIELYSVIMLEEILFHERNVALSVQVAFWLARVIAGHKVDCTTQQYGCADRLALAKAGSDVSKNTFWKPLPKPGYSCIWHLGPLS